MQKDFSYPLFVSDLSSGVKKYKIEANKEELVYLRSLLKVEDVKSFSASLEVSANKKSNLLSVIGSFDAEVEQKSVVSLENFSQRYSDSFDICYNLKPSHHKYSAEEEVDFDDDIIEDVVDGQVDLFHIAAEQLALVLDDYPKKPGEHLDYIEFEEDEKKSPFDILSKLKTGNK